VSNLAKTIGGKAGPDSLTGTTKGKIENYVPHVRLQTKQRIGSRSIMISN